MLIIYTSQTKTIGSVNNTKSIAKTGIFNSNVMDRGVFWFISVFNLTSNVFVGCFYLYNLIGIILITKLFISVYLVKQSKDYRLNIYSQKNLDQMNALINNDYEFLYTNNDLKTYEKNIVVIESKDKFSMSTLIDMIYHRMSNFLKLKVGIKKLEEDNLIDNKDLIKKINEHLTQEEANIKNLLKKLIDKIEKTQKKFHLGQGENYTFENYFNDQVNKDGNVPDPTAGALQNIMFQDPYYKFDFLPLHTDHFLNFLKKQQDVISQFDAKYTTQSPNFNQDPAANIAAEKQRLQTQKPGLETILSAAQNALNAGGGTQAAVDVATKNLDDCNKAIQALELFDSEVKNQAEFAAALEKINAATLAREIKNNLKFGEKDKNFDIFLSLDKKPLKMIDIYFLNQFANEIEFLQTAGNGNLLTLYDYFVSLESFLNLLLFKFDLSIADDSIGIKIKSEGSAKVIDHLDDPIYQRYIKCWLVFFIIFLIKPFFLAIEHSLIESWLSTMFYHGFFKKIVNVEINSFQNIGSSKLKTLVSVFNAKLKPHIFNQVSNFGIIFLPVMINLVCNALLCFTTETPIKNNWQSVKGFQVFCGLSLLSILLGYLIQRMHKNNYRVSASNIYKANAIEEEFLMRMIGSDVESKKPTGSQAENVSYGEVISSTKNTFIYFLKNILGIINIFNTIIACGAIFVMCPIKDTKDFGQKKLKTHIINSIGDNYKFLLSDLKKYSYLAIGLNSQLKDFITKIMKIPEDLLDKTSLNDDYFYHPLALFSSISVFLALMISLLFFVRIFSESETGENIMSYSLMKNIENIKSSESNMTFILNELNELPIYKPNPYKIDVSKFNIVECTGDLSNFALDRHNDDGKVERIKNFEDFVYVNFHDNTLVCGPTGAGKSVVLKMFLNIFKDYLEKDKVFIRFINNEGAEQTLDVKDIETECLLKKIVNVPQFINLPKNLTALDAMKLILQNGANAEIRYYLEMVEFFPEIGDINRPLSTLSGGQEKRLNMAMFISSILNTRDKYINEINYLLRNTAPKIQKNELLFLDANVDKYIIESQQKNTYTYLLMDIINDNSLNVTQNMYFLDEAYVGLDAKKRRNINNVFFTLTRKLLSVKKKSFVKQIYNVCLKSFIDTNNLNGDVIAEEMQNFEGFCYLNSLLGLSNKFYTTSVNCNDIDGDPFNVVLITHLPKEVLNDDIHVDHILYIDKKKVISVAPTADALYRLITQTRQIKTITDVIDTTIQVRRKEIAQFLNKKHTPGMIVINSNDHADAEQAILNQVQIDV